MHDQDHGKMARTQSRLWIWALAVVLAGAGAAVWVIRPQTLPHDALDGLTGVAMRGEQVFWAGGCASCHAAEGATGDARLALGGGGGLKLTLALLSCRIYPQIQRMELAVGARLIWPMRCILAPAQKASITIRHFPIPPIPT